MTDLEMIKRCAERMGYGWEPHHQGRGLPIWLDRESRRNSGIYSGDYDPLHDDAQCMALVKKFGLCIDSAECGDGRWFVNDPKIYKLGMGYAIDEDLNRAICECIARMP